MHLPQKDIDLFYKIHTALLQFVNSRLGLFPNIRTPEEMRISGLENIDKIRQHLWKKSAKFIDEFIVENPIHLDNNELDIVSSWKYNITGKFFIMRHLKKYTIFMDDKDRPRAYGVHSLIYPLKEMMPFIPIYVEATLLPFREKIIYDAVLHHFTITFGPGFRYSLNESYRNAKNNFGIITSIPPNF